MELGGKDKKPITPRIHRHKRKRKRRSITKKLNETKQEFQGRPRSESKPEQPKRRSSKLHKSTGHDEFDEIACEIKLENAKQPPLSVQTPKSRKTSIFKN